MAILGNGVVGLTPEQQALAMWPSVTRNTGGSDGIESSRKDAKGYDENGVASGGNGDPDIQAAGPTLLTVDDPAVLFRVVDGLTRSQNALAANRWAIDLHYRRVRANIPFTYLEKLPNQSQWVAKMPAGVTRERAGSTPNKADDLCNKVETTLEADPARPNPQAHVDSESADQASELASEYLRSIMGETGINWEEKHHWGINVGLTCASAFLHYDVDPEGGGYQPYRVLAHPQATDPTRPMVAQVPGPPDAMGQPTMQDLPTADPVLRFVSADGQFVDDASQADRVWMPGPTCDRIRREQVRMFPPDADIENADAVVLILWKTLSQTRRLFPETVGQMSMTEMQGLASWRPSMGADQVVPFSLRAGLSDGATGPSVTEVGTLSPMMQRRMFWYRLYVKASREYPGGLQLDVSGANGGTVLGKSTLEYQVTLPKDGTTTRCRDIPLEQIRPCQDVDGGDPMGWAFVSRLAGTSDAEQMLYSAYQDAINQRLNPHVFIRSTVAVNDEDWADRSVPIILNPQDQEPTYEQFSALPGEFLPMIENLDQKMNSAGSLGDSAQGLETKTSVSGIAKQITVQQANKDLSGMLQQLNSAKTRGWRILLQIAQAFFSIPQLMQYTGEDGSQQAEWWTGDDLAAVDDIGIEPGTGTTTTPEGKANLVSFAQAQGWLTPQKAAKVGLLGVSRDLGLPDDVAEQAIERSVALWLKGPPNEQWVAQWQQYQTAKRAYDAAQQQFQAQTQAYQTWQMNMAIAAGGAPSALLGPEQQNAQAMDRYQQAVLWLRLNPQAGTPPVPPQTPPPQAPWTPFPQRANDTEPSVALKWMERLSDLQFSPEYTRWPAEWRQCADARYTSARQASAVAAAAAPPQSPSGHPAPQAHPTAHPSAHPQVTGALPHAGTVPRAA